MSSVKSDRLADLPQYEIDSTDLKDELPQQSRFVNFWGSP